MSKESEGDSKRYEAEQNGKSTKNLGGPEEGRAVFNSISTWKTAVSLLFLGIKRVSGAEAEVKFMCY